MTLTDSGGGGLIMKFRTKILAACSIASGFIAAFLCTVMIHYNIQYARESLENSDLKIASTLAGKMDDQFFRMEASTSYILSDPKLLDDIKVLGSDSLPSSYKMEAKTSLKESINTWYICRYNYRLVFFNQKNDLFYSISDTSGNVIHEFSIQDVPFLDEVDAANGHPVILSAHEDFWDSSDNKPQVYSLIRAVQGENTGYLEVQQRCQDLASLKQFAGGLSYLVLSDDGGLLYASRDDLNADSVRTYVDESNGKDRVWTEKSQIVAISTAKGYPITVVTIDSLEGTYRRNAFLYLIPILIALATFSLVMIFMGYWTKVFTKPITQLTDLIQKTELKNLDQQDLSSISSETDEIVRLSRSYQQMTVRLGEAVTNERRAAVLQTQALFDSLQAQVNPHFIYNVLNILAARGVLDNDDMVCEMCGALAGMLRYSTGNKVRYARIKDEMQYLNNYAYLLKARFADNIRFHTDVSADILDELIPKVTFQQIIENSVKHGFSGNVKTLEISVTGVKTETGWKVTILDNGHGISQGTIENIHEKMDSVYQKIMSTHENIEMDIGGMGLINGYARCLLLYGDALRFTVENRTDQSGVQVVIEVSIPDAAGRKNYRDD